MVKVKLVTRFVFIYLIIYFDRFWDYIRSNHPIKTLVHHKEYLSGIDYNIHKPNEVRNWYNFQLK